MNEPILETPAGKLRGRTVDGVHIFKGIPYGTAERFQAPRPASPWAGVRDALDYGPTAPQPARRADQPSQPNQPGVDQGEDCLVLNVWTPGLNDGGKRPIMFWIHGGGFSTGSGSSPRYEGEWLAAHLDAVVVTVNHRLGATGHLYLRHLDRERFDTSGVNSFLDLQLALGWVRDNAAAIGGDAGSVMAFGCSGGGGKVATLMAMPAARGLFQRAGIQSGIKNNADRPVSTVFGKQGLTPDEAELVTSRVMEHLGIGDRDAARLVDVPIEQLVAAQGAVEATGLVFGPVLHEELFPAHPFDPQACPGSLEIPLLIGYNEDEWAPYVALRPEFKDLDDEGVVRWLSRWSLGDDEARRVAAEYRRLLPSATPQERLIAAVSDELIKVPSVQVADLRDQPGAAPVYSYHFTWDSPTTGQAFHALEVPFVFHTLDRTSVTVDGPEQQALADQISAAWRSFAATGDPNHEGLPRWPQYRRERRETMVFDTPCRTQDNPLAERLAIWETII